MPKKLSKTGCECSQELQEYSIGDKKHRINKEVIKWHINDYHPDLDEGKQLREIEAAVDMWKDAFDPIKLEPTKVKREANIVVHFASDNDPYDRPPQPFGGSTLAYAYLPRRNKSDIWIDRDEAWNLEDSRTGVNLRTVVAHEFGHSFNILHTNDSPTDLMNPRYIPGSTITQDSIDAVEALYGDIKKKIADREPSPAPTPTPVPDDSSTGEPSDTESCPVLEFLRTLFSSMWALRLLSHQQRTEIAKFLGVRIPTRPGPASHILHRELHKDK